MLRVIGGFGFVLEQQNEPQLRRIPFVLLAPASASGAEIAEAKQTGSVRIALKPTNPKDLKTMLERLASAMCSDASGVTSCAADF